MPITSPVTDPVEDSASKKNAIHYGWIESYRWRGKDCARIRSSEGLYILWLNDSEPESVDVGLAPDQDVLKQDLKRILLGGTHPCVTFKAAPNPPKALEVRLVFDEAKVLLLPVSTQWRWLVIKSGEAPYSTEDEDVLNIVGPTGTLLAAKLLQCVDPASALSHKSAPDRIQAFVLLERLTDRSLLQSDPEYSRLLAEHAGDGRVDEYLRLLAADYEKDLSKCRNWGEFEEFTLANLEEMLRHIIRRHLLEPLRDDKLEDAWSHHPNRMLIHELHAEWASARQQKDAFDQILRQLGVQATDLEVYRNEIVQAGITDGFNKNLEWKSTDKEKAHSFLRRSLGDPEVGVLAGHNIIQWDLAKLHQVLGADANQLLDRPILDTLLIEAILRPKCLQSLELGGAHNALDDARKTISLLQQQSFRLARLPVEVLEAWADFASPAMHQFLHLVLTHRDQLAGVPNVDVQDADVPSAPPLLLHDLESKLRELPERTVTLVLVPRTLLPYVVGLSPLRNALILDFEPTAQYVESPDSHRTASLKGSISPSGYAYDDLLLLVHAFVRASGDVGQLPHLTTMTSWARLLLKTENILPFVTVGWRSFETQIIASSSSVSVAPIDCLSQQEFIDYVQQRKYEKVILFAPELSATSFIHVKPVTDTVPDSWRIQPTIDGWSMGIDVADDDDVADLAKWGVNLPNGWRGWLKNSGLGAQLHTVPEDITKHVSELISVSASHLIKVGIRPRQLKMTIMAAKQTTEKRKQMESDTSVILSPETKYRADFLGQIVATVTPRAKTKRVLLALSRNQQEVSAVKDSTEGIYVPQGTILRCMQKLVQHQHGLAVCHVDDFLEWALNAQSNGIAHPFDEVILDAWPLDNPVTIPPLTRSELKKLRIRSDIAAEENEDMRCEETTEIDDEGETEGGYNDVEDNSDDTIDGLARPATLSVAQSLLERLRQHAHLLDVLVVSAHELSNTALRVLDVRLQLREQTELGMYNVEPFLIAFDASTACIIAERLKQRGLRDKEQRVFQQLDRSQRDAIARSLFSYDSLHAWQHECLDVIMTPDHPPELIAVTASTGGGKSLVYQFPALVEAMQSGRLTLVVSPLRALMREQCQKLWQFGFVFMVDRLSSDMSDIENQEVYQRIAGGQICLLFVSPERFRSRRFQKALSERISRDDRLQYWVFDEAHCISLWGHSFRPDYLYAAEIARDLRQQYRDKGPSPVLLLTATLPPQVHNELDRLFQSS